MPVTMQDIAKSLRVSVVTVSKVLRHQGNISAKTRDRVLRKAKQVNYQTNWIARSLATRRTYTIGLLLPDFTHPFFGEIAKAVAETVRTRGYHVIISYFEEDPTLEKSEVEGLLARQVDGLIIASAQPPDRPDLFEGIQTRDVPFVLIDRPYHRVRASFVGADNVAMGRLATEHLIAQGCRRIAHLQGPGVGIAAARLRGYRNALRAGRLRPWAGYVVPASYGDASGHEAMRTLLRTKPLPDAVFCYNDPVAIGAIRAIIDEGLTVPGDIAVVGAGNVHYSDMLSVPLTTIDQGTNQIGKQAAELLMEQIESKRMLNPRRVLIVPRLLVRQSSLRAANGRNSHSTIQPRTAES
jgi:LacI family transcriptional regulator